MKGKLNENNFTSWENGDKPEPSCPSNGVLNGSNDINENIIEEQVESVVNSCYSPPNSSRLAWDPALHISGECESFFKNCSESVLSKPLSVHIHFCCEETEKSERKRCRSLQWQKSTCSNSSPVSSPSECTGEFFSKSDQDKHHVNNLNNEVFQDDSPDSSLDCTQSEDTYLQNSSSLPNMGCGQSLLDLPTVDEDDQSHVTIERSEEVGMNTKSEADLLKEQRRLSTDVTPNFANRWLQSHFADRLPSKDGQVKRRNLKNKNRTTDPLVSPSLSNQRRHTDNRNVRAPKTFNILHFNDVYEITERPKDPVGGAARFAQLFKQKVAEVEQSNGEPPLVVFSGDCLNPSTLSCATQGRHMIEILNHLNVDVAVFGNHEFDFGVEHAVKCVKQMNSTWLLANVEDNLTENKLAEGLPYKMITRKNGLKIGLIGLVEEEWLDTLATVNKSDLTFKDYVGEAQRIAKELKEQGAEYIIAVTHMRWPNDVRLAQEVPEVDLILGGHDHGYGVKNIEDCLIVKSGSDFRTFSSIDISLRDTSCIDVTLTRYDVTFSSSVPDPDMLKIVNRYNDALQKSLQKCIGVIKADLNGNFKFIRCNETTLGNFVADIMATVTNADLVLINSGTFRSDTVHKSGDFCLYDLMTILPINDTLVSIVVTGKQLLDAFENGVSKYPNLDGRFPQISGACFGFNPNASPGKRVVQSTIRIRGKPLDLNEKYTLVTKAYVARGKDGYSCLSECPILTDPDSGPLLSTVVRNHILNIKRLMDFETSQACKISVSSDGRQLSCNKPDLDVSRAFDVSELELEAPTDTIQRHMESVISSKDSLFNSNQSSNNQSATENQQKTIRLPNFITVANDLIDCEPGNSEDEDLLRARQSSWSRDEENARLLRERTNNPNDLKWQITPLIEARIFHSTVENNA